LLLLKNHRGVLMGDFSSPGIVPVVHLELVVEVLRLVLLRRRCILITSKLAAVASPALLVPLYIFH